MTQHAVVANERGEPTGTGSGYRPELDGLRALAILVVVAFHAHVPGFDGGFVGVDVFFVLSGWLITRQLVAPLATGTGVSLLDFWARRVRRLVPAMAVMVVAVLLLSVVVLSPLDWHLVAARGGAASIYVSNLLFARSAGDYFSGTLQDSPFLHTWSLGVEEQFYVLWPLAFWAAARLGRRSSAATARRALVAFLGLVLVGSFAIGWSLTRTGSPWAFYGLPARGWEFAAGGLLAVCWPGRPPGPAVLHRALPVVGLGLVAAAVLAFDSATPFPGTAALLPVVGTVLVILGLQAPAARRDVVGTVLSWAPAQRLGRLSYSWYLWHWPLMVLAVQYTYRDEVWVRVAAGLAALPVAALSLRFVEDPVRHARGLRRSPWRTFALGALATIAVVAACLALEGWTRHQLKVAPYAEYAAERSSFDRADCTNERSPGGIGYCVGGAPDGSRTVLLVGDSHARQWMAALSAAGQDLDARVLLHSAANCTTAPLPPVGSSDVLARDCSAHQRDTARLVEELAPDAVVLTDARNSRLLGFDEPADWARAFEAQVADLRRAGAAVGAIVDPPGAEDPLNCLARGRSTSFCTPSRSEGLAAADEFTEAEAEAFAGAGEPLPLVDLTDVICGPEHCDLRHDGVWVFAASGHVTKAFSLQQEPALADLLGELLDGPTA